MKDVNRTEPWALMSAPGGSKAAVSLFKGDTFWVKDAWSSVRNYKKPGGIRWAPLIAIASTMTGSILINPLSAGLLNVQDITTVQAENFVTIAPPASPVPLPDITDTTYMSAIASFVYNISSSAWLTSEYAIMPFWPSTVEMPLGSQLSTTPQVWSGSTNVFKVQFECENTSTISISLAPAAIPDSAPSYRYDVVLQARDGCLGSFYVNDVRSGGGAWGQVVSNRNLIC